MKATIVGKGKWGSILKKYVPRHFQLESVCDSKTNLSKVFSHVKAVFIATPADKFY